jgi:hypothetical protein
MWLILRSSSAFPFASASEQDKEKPQARSRQPGPAGATLYRYVRQTFRCRGVLVRLGWAVRLGCEVRVLSDRVFFCELVQKLRK